MLLKIFNHSLQQIPFYKEQSEYLSLILETRKSVLTVEFLQNLGCFFVPDEDYIFNCLGEESEDPKYGFYEWDGSCKWENHLMIPIRNSRDEIAGFTGFNPLSKLVREDNRDKPETEQIEAPPKYEDSPAKVLDKTKHLLCPLGYEKMLQDDYVFIVDGVFDALVIASLGFNSIANLGTILSKECQYIMSLPSKRIVIPDNDDAGNLLVRNIKSSGNRPDVVIQPFTKDIDDFANKVGSESLKSQLAKILEDFGVGIHELNLP